MSEKIVQVSTDGEHWNEIKPSDLIGDEYLDEALLDAKTVYVILPSQLQRIVDLNNLWGNHKAESEEELYGQLSLIEEEWYELLEAISNNDTKETLKECADLIFTTAGMIHQLGYNPDEVMGVINDSNESKVVDPTSDEEVTETLRLYHNSDRYESPYVDIHGVVKAKVKDTGCWKVVKGVNYHGCRWEEIDEGLV